MAEDKNEELPERLKEFVKYMGKSSSVDGSLRVYNSSTNPNEKTKARRNLEGLIVDSVPHARPFVGQKANDYVINRYGLEVKDVLENKGINKFKEDPYVLIKDARTAGEDAFKEKYLAITPLEVNYDEEHNKIAKYHKNFKEFLGKVQSYDPRNAKSHEAFIKDTFEDIKNDLVESLGAENEGLISLVIESYAQSTPQEALAVANATLNSIRNKMDKALPEDKRADYVEKILKARVDAGGDEVSMAAKELYGIIS